MLHDDDHVVGDDSDARTKTRKKQKKGQVKECRCQTAKTTTTTKKSSPCAFVILKFTVKSNAARKLSFFDSWWKKKGTRLIV